LALVLRWSWLFFATVALWGRHDPVGFSLTFRCNFARSLMFFAAFLRRCGLNLWAWIDCGDHTRAARMQLRPCAGFVSHLPPHVMALWRQRDAGNGGIPPM
jgi:hypothetical protein